MTYLDDVSHDICTECIEGKNSVGSNVASQFSHEGNQEVIEVFTLERETSRTCAVVFFHGKKCLAELVCQIEVEAFSGLRT